MVLKKKYVITMVFFAWLSLSIFIYKLFIGLNLLFLFLSLIHILKKVKILSLIEGKLRYTLPFFFSFCFLLSISESLPKNQLKMTNEIENKNTKNQSSMAYKMVYGDKNSNKNLSGAKLTEWKAAKTSDKDFTSNIIIEIMSKNGMINKNKMGANPKKELKDCIDTFIKASNNDVLKSQDVSSLGMLCAFQMGWK